MASRAPAPRSDTRGVDAHAGIESRPPDLHGRLRGPLCVRRFGHLGVRAVRSGAAHDFLFPSAVDYRAFGKRHCHSPSLVRCAPWLPVYVDDVASSCSGHKAASGVGRECRYLARAVRTFLADGSVAALDFGYLCAFIVSPRLGNPAPTPLGGGSASTVNRTLLYLVLAAV